MNETNRKTRRRLSEKTLTVLISVILTAAVLVSGVFFLLGREGLAVVQGWILARWAFVETDVDLQKVSDWALSGTVEAMGDRWSYYLTRENYETILKQRANRYVGIGITVSYEHEAGPLILAVTAGSPAEAGGIVAGEVILAVEGVDATGADRTEVVKLIAGKEGEKRTVTILGLDGERRDVTMTLASIVTRVATGELLEGNVGLVRLINFNSGSADALRKETEQLIEQGATALIFDVRGNGGGYVSQLTDILDYLLPEGVVFQSVPRWGKGYETRSDAACIDLPFVVLVDANSYSAAELFAAQLRESRGTPIVGELTSGKGYSQDTFPLLNGGAIGVSTAAYFTGSGVSLIGTGLTPDVELSLTEEQEARRAAGSLDWRNDPHILAALELLQE